MDLIDEVDYHCCMHCDNIYPTEYELLAHVTEIHPDPADFGKRLDEAMQFDQSVLVDNEGSVQTDDYLDTLLNDTAQKVYNIITIYLFISRFDGKLMNLCSLKSSYYCFYQFYHMHQRFCCQFIRWNYVYRM